MVSALNLVPDEELKDESTIKGKAYAEKEIRRLITTFGLACYYKIQNPISAD